MTTGDARDPSTWRLSTPEGIPYKLLDGYPTFGVQHPDGATAAEKLLIRGTDLGAFLSEIFPPPREVLGLVIYPETRRLPGTDVLVAKTFSAHPYNPGLPGDPFSTDTSAPSGTYSFLYEVDIGYETDKKGSKDSEEEDPNEPESFLRHSITAGGEFITIPAQALKHQTKGRPPPFRPDVLGEGAIAETESGEAEDNLDQLLPITKIIPITTHTLEWRQVPLVPWGRIRNKLGHVNSDVIPLFDLAQPETVLFTGVNGSQEYLWDGRRPWTLQFTFVERYLKETGRDGNPRIVTWNHVYVPDVGRFQKLTLPPTHTKFIYESTTFNDMFRADPETEEE